VFFFKNEKISKRVEKLYTNVDIDLNKEKIFKNVNVPVTLKPDKTGFIKDSEILMNFISSQHPLINTWFVFSLFSIVILSVLLYFI